MSWTKSSFHFSMPNLVEESENQTVPSEAIAALLQNSICLPATLSVTGSTAPVAVSMRSTPRCASQTSSRPSGSISRPSGRPPVWATRSIRRPSWLTRKMLPSSVPVNTAPSSGPCVATTTSSAPGPGTGTSGQLHAHMLR